MAKRIPNSLPCSSFLNLIETLVIFFFSFLFLFSLLYRHDRQSGGEHCLYYCVESCRSPQILGKARRGWVGQGGGVVRMVLLWILLLLCTVCTQGGLFLSGNKHWEDGTQCSRPGDCGGHSWHHSEQVASVFLRNDVLQHQDRQSLDGSVGVRDLPFPTCWEQ